MRSPRTKLKASPALRAESAVTWPMTGREHTFNRALGGSSR